MIEYRVCWSASSNASFRGNGEWNEWGGDPDITEEDIELALTDGGSVSDGLNEAMEASGFEWWIETRQGDA